LPEEKNLFLTKGEVVGVEEESDGSLKIDLDETLLGENIQIKADMLVLASGMVPTTKVDEVEEMSNSYKKNGFATVTGKGYDKIFVVNTNVIGDEYVRSYYTSEPHDKDYLDDLETNKKGVFTTKQLTSALGKNVSQKSIWVKSIDLL